MARILHITDPHIVVPPAKASDILDTAALFEHAVARIEDRLSKIGSVDAILVTGDISDDGSPDSYGLFRRLIAPLDLPVFAIPGNHDLREPMRAGFADLGYMPDAGRLNWARDIGGLRLIGLDTLVEGQGGGVLDRETLDFLSGALPANPEIPILLAVHHPPFASGIRFMDSLGLDGIDGLQNILDASSHDVRIVCGHIHIAMIGAVGRVTALSGPAPCSTFDVDFRADAPVGFMTAPGGFMIHDWADGFRSVHVAPEQGDGPFSF